MLRRLRLRDDEKHESSEHAGQVWTWVRETRKEFWRAWILHIGPALVAIRAEAKEMTKSKPGNYSRYMSDLLTAYHFDNMNKDERAAIFNIMDNLNAVQTWRSKQENPDALNNPEWVWRQYQKSSNKKDERDANKKPNVNEPEADLKQQNEELRERINEVEEELRAAKEKAGPEEEDDSDKPIFERIASWSTRFFGLWRDTKSWPKLTKAEERKREKLLAALSKAHQELRDLAETAAKRENPDVMMDE